MEFEATRAYLVAAGFSVLNHYYRPAGAPRTEQPWLAIVSQKIFPDHQKRKNRTGKVRKDVPRSRV